LKDRPGRNFLAIDGTIAGEPFGGWIQRASTAVVSEPGFVFQLSPFDFQLRESG
jgi:hypothetical protein